MTDAPTEILYMPPGSMIIVGPLGCIRVAQTADGRTEFLADKCDFYFPPHASPAMRDLVAKVWENRTEYGFAPRNLSPVDLPAAVRVSRPDPDIRRRAVRLDHLPPPRGFWAKLLRRLRVS